MSLDHTNCVHCAKLRAGKRYVIEGTETGVAFWLKDTKRGVTLCLLDRTTREVVNLVIDALNQTDDLDATPAGVMANELTQRRMQVEDCRKQLAAQEVQMDCVRRRAETAEQQLADAQRTIKEHQDEACAEKLHQAQATIRRLTEERDAHNKECTALGLRIKKRVGDLQQRLATVEGALKRAQDRLARIVMLVKTDPAIAEQEAVLGVREVGQALAPAPGGQPKETTMGSCPTCESPAPHLHPAVQHGGEVQPCRDEWHEAEEADAGEGLT